MAYRFRSLVPSGAAALLLAGCGGGGGGAPTIPAPPVTTTTPPDTVVTQPTPPVTPTPTAPATGTSLDTTEYQRSGGAVQANALAGYTAGYTGRGITAAVIDSGIASGSAEFAGRISAASADLVSTRGIGDEDGHGTAVAGVLAAARNDSGILGIAYDASLLVLRTDNVGSCTGSADCKHGDAAIVRAIDVAVANRARVINISLGGDAGGSAFRAAIGRATAAGIVVVMAAGNDATANPDGFAQVAQTAEARGLVIVAGATDATGDLASFSSRAGVSADFYLSALGDRVRSFDQTGAAFLYSGTSFSAPLISGAVALLAQAFPNLTGADIVRILYETAVDQGAAGVDAVYGRGRLDLTRAFAPRGATALAGSAIPVSTESNGMLSSAMGDGGHGGTGAVMLDGYGRAYRLDLAATLSRARVQPRLLAALAGGGRQLSGSVPGAMFAVTIADRGQATAIERLTLDSRDADAARATAGMVATRIGGGLQLGFGFAQGSGTIVQAMAGRGSPFLVAGDADGMAGEARRAGSAMAIRRDLGGWGLTATAEQGDALTDLRTAFGRLRRDGHGYARIGIAADRRIGAVTLAAGLSRLREAGTMLGGRFDAAFGGAGATSDFVDLSARADLAGGWSLSAAGRGGWTRGDAGGVGAGARLRSSAWSLDAAKAGLFGRDWRGALRIAQPLRVERGGFALMLPTGYDYATGAVTTALQRIDLAPHGREIDVEGSLGRPMLGGWMATNLFWRRDPGNIAALPADMGAAVRYSAGF